MKMAKLMVYGAVAMIGINAVAAYTTSNVIAQMIGQITKAVSM